MVKVAKQYQVSNPSLPEVRARIDARAALAWKLAQAHALVVSELAMIAAEGGAA